MNRQSCAREYPHRRFARARRWLIPATLLALAPKCVLCALAYAGFGAALGFGGPEICGDTGSATGHWIVWVPLWAGTTVAIRKLQARTR